MVGPFEPYEDDTFSNDYKCGHYKPLLLVVSIDINLKN